MQQCPTPRPPKYCSWADCEIFVANRPGKRGREPAKPKAQVRVLVVGVRTGHDRRDVEPGAPVGERAIPIAGRVSIDHRRQVQ